MIVNQSEALCDPFCSTRGDVESVQCYPAEHRSLRQRCGWRLTSDPSVHVKMINRYLGNEDDYCPLERIGPECLVIFEHNKITEPLVSKGTTLTLLTNCPHMRHETMIS